MSFEYTIDTDHRVVRVRLSGVLTCEDVVQYGVQVTRDLPDGVTFAEWVDFRKLDSIGISYDETSRLKDVFAGLKANKGYRGTVMLVGSDYQFGMARMLSAAMGEVGRVYVVRDEREADEKLLEILEDDSGETS